MQSFKQSPTYFMKSTIPKISSFNPLSKVRVYPMQNMTDTDMTDIEKSFWGGIEKF